MRYPIASSFVVLALIGTIGAAEIYTSHARHTELGTIDPNTGVGTNIGSFQQPELLLASGAFDVDGQFYSIALLPGLTDSQLARVDTATGEATLIGEPTGEFVVPLEVSDEGTMYTVGYYWPEVLGVSTNLFTVNKTDGQITAVGATGVTRPMDLAFDSQATLWLVSGGDDGNHLYTLNQATGEATLVSTVTGVEEATEPGAEIMGIMFDEHDTLFATAYYRANPDFVSPLFRIDPTSGVATVVGNTGLVNPHGGDILLLPPQLQAGDADQNLDFDQFDLIQVQQAAKYLTGQAATWGEGDWDGAPGGHAAKPPAGDGVFDQQDIVAAQQNGLYGTGGYAAVQPRGAPGDAQTSVGYDAGSGEIWVDSPAGRELTSVNIDSASGIFTGQAAQNLGGSFDHDADGNIFKATFGSSFGSLSFGNVAQAGLSEAFVLNDLSVVGSLAGGGDLGNVDLVYVPEPAAFGLLAFGMLIVLPRSRHLHGLHGDARGKAERPDGPTSVRANTGRPNGAPDGTSNL